ncbi:MAG: B12-binding domain-containing radical SAM protein [Nanoarchaeota archaeon]|nr:B12-binding domain-containing radical SAM protein [Nanoarchaeota archaeon]MBU1103109.1 B12-binding domain-containing radical SAM protein [Nanoarchaeota archaeon]
MRCLFVFKSVEWMGVEYLSSALKKAGHITDLAFESGLEGTFYIKTKKSNHKSIFKKVAKFKPDLILFSCTTNIYPWVREVASGIKKRFNIPIIVGGIHPTIIPEKVIEDKNIDMVCVGEGEGAIVELVNKMESGRECYHTRNIWFKVGDKIIRNKVRPLISDLDSLPFPDKDLFYKYGCFTDRVYIMANRGCPYKCTYCFNHQFQKLYKGTNSCYLRTRSIGSVIKELKLYKKKYRTKSVHFYDDTFILNKTWVLDLCKRYKEEINLPFYCLVRANLVDEDIIRALKNAGCTCVGMGIESGNSEIRNKVLKRNMTNDQIIRASEIIKKYKIKLVTFNIFGFPDETPLQMLETMNINLKICPDSLFTYTFYPFYGTDLMVESLKKGYIDQEVIDRIVEGTGNYASESLLKHPHKNEAYNMKVILPLLNKLPRRMHGLFLKEWVFKKHSDSLLNVIKVLSIPFYSRWEAGQRFKEQLSMLRVHYLKNVS